VGFDGTVDIICRPVAARRSHGDDYDSFRTISAFGNHVVGADGHSALVEIVPKKQKIGGNGPLMAEAMARFGARVEYIGTIGAPALHPAYADFSSIVKCVSLGEPAITHALEFDNGKVMLSTLSAYDVISPASLAERVGTSHMATSFSQADLVGLFNWACLPHFVDVLQWLLEEVLPSEAFPNPKRWFFFDLTDPSRRTPTEIVRALELMAAFGRFGRTILGMNLNEIRQVSAALSLPEPTNSATGLATAAQAVRKQTGFNVVMAHPARFAAAAGEQGTAVVAGPFTAQPRITTGAGDHLNAGFAFGLTQEWPIDEALALGVLFSGFYVREGRSPQWTELARFLDVCLEENLISTQ
jgi:sugar/nucleoside kinase (ribokinase family)